MSIFSEIEAPTHLKGGILGFAGSGKTTTMALIAIGLWKMLNEKSGYDKPVLFLDTEKGSEYVKDIFDGYGVPIQGKKTRAFVTLMAALEEAIKGENILLTDSITHFWQELMGSYMKKKSLTSLTLYHIMNVKKEWQPFPELYLNSPIHSILCGRAGIKWGKEENEETGKKELVDKGTKMKVEGDFGYEPTLLIEMEQVRQDKDITGSPFINRAWVLKDKFMSSGLQGEHFDFITKKNIDFSAKNETFESFLPHISRLNLGGKHSPIDLETNSQDMIESPDRSREFMYKQRDIYIEELKNELTLKFNSRTDEGKKQALGFLQETFNTTSMTAISGSDNFIIKEGLDKLRKFKPEEIKKETKPAKKGKK